MNKVSKPNRHLNIPPPRDGYTKCWNTIAPNTRCAEPFDKHGPNGECPQNSVKTFRKHPTNANAASQSFSEEEVSLLDQLLTGLRSKRDLSILARHPAMGSIARKVMGMRNSIKKRREEGGSQNPDDS